MKGFNWKKITKQSEFYVFLIIVVLSVIIQIRSGLFFANNNIVDIMRSMIVPCIYALCAFLAFISTGPDVSFPLIAALSYKDERYGWCYHCKRSGQKSVRVGA